MGIRQWKPYSILLSLFPVHLHPHPSSPTAKQPSASGAHRLVKSGRGGTPCERWGLELGRGKVELTVLCSLHSQQRQSRAVARARALYGEKAREVTTLQDRLKLLSKVSGAESRDKLMPFFPSCLICLSVCAQEHLLLERRVALLHTANADS